jgi:site-specific recombinase XerD
VLPHGLYVIRAGFGGMKICGFAICIDLAPGRARIVDKLDRRNPPIDRTDVLRKRRAVLGLLSRADVAGTADVPRRWVDVGARMNVIGPVIEQAIEPALRAQVEAIAAPPRTTPFLHYLDDWKPHAGLKPRPLDQAISSLNHFDKAVAQPIQALEAKHVQNWIDQMIQRPPVTIKRKTGKVSIILPPKAKTVARMLSEVRNYWRYLQSLEIVAVDRDPFANRRVKDPADRRETSDDKRQKWQPAQVVALWQHAATNSDLVLSNVVRIAAYSGARIEGIAQLKVSSIRTDPATGIRFMHMADKSIGGDRDVPIHPMIDGLIDDLIKMAKKDGYLIESSAGSKYTERGAPLGQRFGRMKTRLGYDHRFVFHSIRKTVTSLMQDASVAEGVAADIVGHIKPGLTYGVYGGITAMPLRAAELTRAISYPVAANGETGTASSIT